MEALLYFLFWAALFVVMMRFGCGGHVMGGAHGRRGREQVSDDAALRWIAPETDVDPVCGRTVRTNAAKTAVHEGSVYYFCSSDCRAAFEGDPDRHSGGSAVRERQRVEHGHD